MRSDFSMSLHAEVDKAAHQKDKSRQKPKPFFQRPQEKGKMTHSFPSADIQEAIQRLLQNSLNNQADATTIAPPLQPIQSLMTGSDLQADALKERSIAATAQIEALFDKMVDSITHCMDLDIKETSVTLGEGFSNSCFNGATITITEYSSAPKIFNIALSASPEALTFFQASAADLVACFQKSKFDFQVNRCEADFSSNYVKGKVPPIDKEMGQNL